MKMLAIGGSNSAAVPGYITPMVDMLRSVHHLPITEVVNASVGGNDCVFGLSTLLKIADLPSFDIALVEFCINDTRLANDRSWQTWRAAYEGILRRLISANPSMKIYSVLFGRRKPENHEKSERLFAAIERLSEIYQTDTIPVDRRLRAIARDDVAGLYCDDAHYARPMMAAFAGHIASSYIAATIANRPLRSTIEPDYPAVFDVISNVTPTFDGVQQASFTNSRYGSECVVLEAGRDYEIMLPGTVAMVEFCAAPNSGTLLIDEDGEIPIAIETAHDDVLSGEYRWLIKAFVFSWKHWDQYEPGRPRRVAFRVNPPGAPLEPARKLHPIWKMVAPSKQEAAPKVFLSTVTCY